MFTSSGLEKYKADALINQIMSDIRKHLNKNFSDIQNKYSKITYEDAQIISRYTCELNKKYEIYNPYSILNKNLVSDDRENGIRNVSKYLFIFLKALRKLDIFYPEKKRKYLYRGIRTKVELNYDSFNKMKIPYLRGEQKMFWAFSSASNDTQTAIKFLKENINKNKSGTIFTLTGNVWGYDISLFNVCHEKEILLEPERKIIIKEFIPPINDIIYVRCKILEDTSLVLENIFNKKNINNNKLNIDSVDNFNINKYLNEINKGNIFKKKDKIKLSQTINTEPNSSSSSNKTKKWISSKSEQNLLTNKFNTINNNNNINQNDNNLFFSKHKKQFSNNTINDNNQNFNKKFNTIDNNDKKNVINKKDSINKPVNPLIPIANDYELDARRTLHHYSGTYEIYYGININSKEKVSIHLEPIDCLKPLFFNEAKICQALQGGLGIPKLH